MARKRGAQPRLSNARTDSSRTDLSYSVPSFSQTAPIQNQGKSVKTKLDTERRPLLPRPAVGRTITVSTRQVSTQCGKRPSHGETAMISGPTDQIALTVCSPMLPCNHQARTPSPYGSPGLSML